MFQVPFVAPPTKKRRVQPASSAGRKEGKSRRPAQVSSAYLPAPVPTIERAFPSVVPPTAAVPYDELDHALATMGSVVSEVSILAPQ